MSKQGLLRDSSSLRRDSPTLQRDSPSLEPAFDSPLRVSSLSTVVINLTSTIVGGGILSLPFTLKSCGLVLGLSTLAAAAAASAFTMRALIRCGRAVGVGDDFAAVASAAFGGRAAAAVTDSCIFVLTFFVIVANGILIADTADKLGLLLLAAAGTPGAAWPAAARRAAILAALDLGVVYPLAAQRRLHALRHAG